MSQTTLFQSCSYILHLPFLNILSVTDVRHSYSCITCKITRPEKLRIIITKTSQCNEHSLTPHFYIVKLGFTGVYFFVVFLFLLQNIDCGYSLQPTINVLSKKKEKYYNFSSENNHFYSREILQYIARTFLCDVA